MKIRLVVALLFTAGCGSSLGSYCESDADCGGLSCIKWYQVDRTGIDGSPICEYNYKVCTMRCDGSCDEGSCSGADSCGGSNNLCRP